MFDIDEERSELTRTDLSPAYIQHRLDDWQQRVETVTAQLETWSAEEGFAVRRGAPIRTQEHLMVPYELPAVDLPTLEVTAPTHNTYHVVPKALWIVGGNGRIDLTTRRGLYQIVDLALPFQQPNWRIAGPTLRKAPNLSRASFSAAVLGE